MCRETIEAKGLNLLMPYVRTECEKYALWNVENKLWMVNGN